MKFGHPLRGTCNDPSCPSYGVCHCGCGGTPSIQHRNHLARDLTAQQPRVYVHGHHWKHVKSPHPRNGAWSRNGMSVRTLLPEIEALYQMFGSDKAGELAGVSGAWVRAARRGRLKRTNYGTAQRIVAAARGIR